MRMVEYLGYFKGGNNVKEQMIGKPAAERLTENLKIETDLLIEKGIKPKLLIMRVGEKSDDLAYEKGALSRCSKIGVGVEVRGFSEHITTEEFIAEIEKANNDTEIHGILIFRPLPKQIDENIIKHIISPKKDIDCFNPINSSKLLEGDKTGFAPCTAEAVMQLLKHYNVDLTGKRTVVIGRSMVIGKPVALMLLNENATVTICHSKTKDLNQVCAEADILIAALGKAKIVDDKFIKEGAIIIDVGINVDEAGNMVGDVDFEKCNDKAAMITPVPGGVGSVTTTILASHVIKACKYMNKI